MQGKSKTKIDVHNGFGEWGGYMDAKKSKLEEQFARDALMNPYKESNLFAGVSIFVNGLTNPSAGELKRIMMTHGGVYHTYRKSSTTFIIATNLPDVKIRQITSAKIINPQWVVDCLAANRLLDYSNYLLYTNCKESQPKIAFKKKEDDDLPDVVPTDISTNDDPQTNIVFNLDVLNVAIRRDEQLKAIEPEPKSLATTDQTKDDPKKKQTKTAVDPNFLAEFYNNSRLHHIATLGASFKLHVSKIRDSHDGQFPVLDQLKNILLMTEAPKDYKHPIMHIDMDCFFVSVGLRSRPQLRGFPIAVTHSKGHNANNLKSINGVDRKKEMELYIKRHEEKHNIDHSDLGDEESRLRTMPLIDNTVSLSEIASCSYEARKMGVKNGMFVGAALKLCPELKTIPYDFDSYKEVAHTLYDVIAQYTVDIEAVSCDEMYVDLTNILRQLGCSVDEFVAHIRNEISEKTGCPCSAGIGENKLQARMATKKAKPNGQYHLKIEDVEEYFRNISISDLPGVGYSTTQKCNKLSMSTCEDLQQVPLVKLQSEFGKKMGETLYQNCRGIDKKPLTYDQVRKSVSAEVNYGIRFTEQHELSTFLHQLCSEVKSRLDEISAKGKTVTLKYMVRNQDAPVETAKYMGHGFCDNMTKSITLPAYTCELSVITQTVFNIKDVLNVEPQELRGIGIQISKLNLTHNNTTKSNALKNMFEKCRTKKIETNAIDLQNHTQKPSRTSLVRAKSFNGTPTHGFQKLYADLDMNVLAELPQEIQNEILNEQFQFKKDEETKRAESGRRTLSRKLENDFVDNEPPLIELKPHTRISIDKFVSEENIFKSNEWQQILSHWLENSSMPIDCDVEVISTFLSEFTRAQQLTDLLVRLRYLHRRMAGMDCAWHQVYKRFHKTVQDEIKLKFGSNVTFHANDKFNCRTC